MRVRCEQAHTDKWCENKEWDKIRNYLKSPDVENDKTVNMIQWKDRDRGDGNSLHWACIRDPPPDVVELLIRYGGGKDLVLMKNNHGSTAFHYVCYFGASIDVMKLLVDEGGKELIMMQNTIEGGDTALHTLCERIDEHKDATQKIRWLLENCDDMEELRKVKNNEGQTALDVAIIQNASPSITLLLTQGQNLDTALEQQHKTVGYDDNPKNTNDDLGYIHHAEALVEVVDSMEKSPGAGNITIGLFAPWGVGKSKLWYLIKQKLNDADIDNQNKQEIISRVQQNEEKNEKLLNFVYGRESEEWNYTRFYFRWTVAGVSKVAKKIANCRRREERERRKEATCSAEDVAILWWMCCCPISLILFLSVVMDLLRFFERKIHERQENNFWKLLGWLIGCLIKPFKLVHRKSKEHGIGRAITNLHDIDNMASNYLVMASNVYQIITGRTFHGLKAKLRRKTIIDSIQVLVLFVFGIIVKLIRYALRGTLSVCSVIFNILLCVPSTKEGDIEEGKEKKRDYPFKHIHVEFNAWSYNGSDNLWASLIQTLQKEIYKHHSPTAIKWHRVSVALSDEKPDDSLEVRQEKRKHALRRFFLTTTLTGILAIGGIVAAIYLVFLFNDECPKTAKASLLCNDLVRKMVGSLVGIAGTATFFFKVYTIFSKVLPFLKTPSAILLNHAAKATGTQQYDFRAKMGFMGEVQKEMNYLFDFIRTNPVLLANGVEVLLILSIFVDDLDRCNPQTIQSVLDAIYLMLETNKGDPGIAICWIAVDTRIVVSSINAISAGVLRNAGVDGYDYMEKLIQVPFSIPLMTARNKERLMTKMVTPLISEAKIFDQLILNHKNCNKYEQASKFINDDERLIDLKILKELDNTRLEDLQLPSWDRYNPDSQKRNWNGTLETIKELVGDDNASPYAQQLAKDFDTENEIFVASKYVRYIEGLAMLLSTYPTASSSKNVEDVRDEVEEGGSIVIDGGASGTDNTGDTFPITGTFPITLGSNSTTASGNMNLSIAAGSSSEAQSVGIGEIAGTNDDDGKVFPIDKHTCVSGSMQPDEERWMRELSRLFPSRARSLKRVMNVYTVGRQVAVKTLVSDNEKKHYYNDKFRRKLIKATLLAEVWPCRMAWLLQIAEDILQEDDVEKGKAFDKQFNLAEQGINDSSLNLKQAVITTCAGKARQAEELLNFPMLLTRLSLLDVYRKVVKCLIHAMPKDDSASLLLDRDEDPQMFEMLLQEYDEDLEDVLTMADLHPPDNSRHFKDLSMHSLRPYIFNLPNHMLQEVTKTLSSILLEIVEEKKETVAGKKYLVYKTCSKFYNRSSS